MKFLLALVLASTCTLALPAADTKSADPAATPASFELKDVDTPPQIVRRAPAKYPKHLRRENISGEAMLKFVVDATGETRDIEVIKATHPEFGPAAVACVKQWRFKPALKAGQPVKCRMQQPIVFNIR